MVEEKVEKKAYPGTISSIILSIVVVGILLVPFATANYVQKVRGGDGKYQFKETMCWDIDEESDFNNAEDGGDCGEGALGYDYDNGISGLSLNHMTFTDGVLEGTVDGYGTGTVIPCGVGSIDFSIIIIFLTITKDDIIDNDVTRIDIFLSVTGTEDYVFDAVLLGAGELYLGEITVGELTEIEVTVDDMMEIYTFDEEVPLILAFIPTEEGEIVQPEDIVFFDMQFYCVEEIKIGAMEWLGIAMVAVGVFMGFCAVLMLPSIDFRGITKSIFKPTGGE